MLAGTYVPVDDAPEWARGAACMANDPRDKKRNNALLTFVKPRNGSKALRDLALLRPQLMATRDIQPGEEVSQDLKRDGMGTVFPAST